MRILGPVVQSFVLAMIKDRETDFPVGGTIRTQFVRDHHTGNCTLI
jgi:hypothetical protein